MKLFPFNNYLRNENNDDGSSNPGGGAALTQTNKVIVSDDSPEDHGISDDDIELYNAHQRKIGGRTTDGKTRSGTLEKALESSLGGGAGKGNEQPKDDVHVDKKESVVNKDTKDITKEVDEEDEILKLNPSELRSKSGAPITKEAQDNFEKLRGYTKKYKDEVAELKSKLASTQSTENTKPTAEYEAMEKELKELRNRIDIEQFETSVGFIHAYEKPMNDAKSAVAKFFPPSMDDKDFVKLNAAFKSAHDAVIKDDEATFYRIVDDIADELVDGGASMKAAFANRMTTYYEKLKTWADAKSSKSEERKAFVEKTMQESRGKNSKGVEVALDDYVSRVLVDKSELLDSIDPEEKEKYVKSIRDNASVVKRQIANMTITGEVSKDLSSIIQKGVTFDALFQENATLAQGFRDADRKIKILEERLAKFEDSKKGATKKDSARYPIERTNQSTDKFARKEGEGAIEFSIRKQKELAS